MLTLGAIQSGPTYSDVALQHKQVFEGGQEIRFFFLLIFISFFSNQTDNSIFTR